MPYFRTRMPVATFEQNGVDSQAYSPNKNPVYAAIQNSGKRMDHKSLHVMSHNAVFPDEKPPEVEHFHTKHSPARDKKPNLSPVIRSPKSQVYDRFAKEEYPEY